MNKENNLWEELVFQLKNNKLIVFLLFLVVIIGGMASLIKDSKTIYEEVESLNQCGKQEKIFKSQIIDLSNRNVTDLTSSDVKRIELSFTKLIQEYCNPINSNIEILSKEFKTQISAKVEEQFKQIQKLREEKGNEYFDGIEGVKEVEKLSTFLESYKKICQNGNLEFKDFCTAEETKRITQTINKLQ